MNLSLFKISNLYGEFGCLFLTGLLDDVCSFLERDLDELSISASFTFGVSSTGGGLVFFFFTGRRCWLGGVFGSSLGGEGITQLTNFLFDHSFRLLFADLSVRSDLMKYEVFGTRSVLTSQSRPWCSLFGHSSSCLKVSYVIRRLCFEKKTRTIERATSSASLTRLNCRGLKKCDLCDLNMLLETRERKRAQTKLTSALSCPDPVKLSSAAFLRFCGDFFMDW